MRTREVRECGMIELRSDRESGMCLVLIENVNRSEEHWLTLISAGVEKRAADWLRATPPHQLRPAYV